jgi:SAM-dependent methyltransferase
MARAKGRRDATTARFDRHAYYERAVQDPENDAAMLAKLFRRYRTRPPMRLREDFCGTATLSAHWARAQPGRTAIGVDLDGATLEWGRKHHLPGVEARVELVQGNVLDGDGAKADIGCAMNFSYSVFKTREALRKYFEVARGTLVKDGVFVLDAWGGWGSMKPERERKRVGNFYYEWEQVRFDPLTNEILCHIHFELAGGIRIDRAFTYDWRLWTVQELRELLLEAGFSKVHALWERTDADGDDTGVFYEPRRIDNQEKWWTYVVAER